MLKWTDNYIQKQMRGFFTELRVTKTTACRCGVTTPEERAKRCTTLSLWNYESMEHQNSSDVSEARCRARDLRSGSSLSYAV